MKINFNLIKTKPDQAFKASKNAVSRIKIARDLNNKEVPINDYVREMLTVYGDKIENVANFLNKDVVLAQKGNLILANSGSKTSVTDLSKIEKGEDLINGIINNLKINA